MQTLRTYPSKTLIGKVGGESIYLRAPSWDCDWYWGFGYLGNRNCHYHVDSIDKNVNLHDALINHFGDSLVVKGADVWKLAELFKTFYTLRSMSDLTNLGGSHITSNPCKEMLKDDIMFNHINSVLIPNIINEIYKVLGK